MPIPATLGGTGEVEGRVEFLAYENFQKNYEGAVGEIARMLGLGSSDPAKMSEDAASRVLNDARKQQPEVL